MRIFRCWIAIGLMTLVVPAFGQTAPKPAASSESGGTNDIGPPLHPATEDQIREYLALTGVSKMGHTLMSQMVEGMRVTAAPYFPQTFWDDMNTELQKVDLVAVYAKVYPQYLSQEDMANVIAFYRSASGKRLLESQPLAIRDAQQILREEGRKIGEAVYEKHKDEIDAAKKKFESGPAAPATK